MKKLVLLLFVAVLSISCQQEATIPKTSSDLEFKSTSTDQNDVDRKKYFGVFVTTDMDLHGELRIDLENDVEFPAIVTLLNSDILKFKVSKYNDDQEIIHFKGERGSFTLDFTDKSNIITSNFLVDGKEGYIKTYVQPRGFVAILFGTYVDDVDPAFTGIWDMINFGAMEPTTGFPLIEDIVITHTPGGMFADETFGVLEPFLNPPCVFPPLAPVMLVGGVTDGIVVSGVDQVATFAGIPTLWTMVALAPTGFITFGCVPLPPTIHGVWSRGPKTGTITVTGPASPPW